MEKLQSFFQEARQEFKRINWPTSQETVRLTVVVIAMSLGIAVFLGAVDFGFFYVLNNFILQ